MTEPSTLLLGVAALVTGISVTVAAPGGGRSVTGTVAAADSPGPAAAVPLVRATRDGAGSSGPTGAGQSVPSRRGWRWPVEGRTPTVLRRFHVGPQRWSPGHRGVDLAAGPGQQVLAAGAGRVSFAGVVAGRAVVTVDHPGGLRTTYEPVVASVTVGSSVAAGQPIGTMQAGGTHCEGSTCLHWGLRLGERYLDPLLLLHPPHPVLLRDG